MELKDLTAFEVLIFVMKKLENEGYPPPGFWREVYWLPWSKKLYMTEPISDDSDLVWDNEPVWICNVKSPAEIVINGSYELSLEKGYFNKLYEEIDERLNHICLEFIGMDDNSV